MSSASQSISRQMPGVGHRIRLPIDYLRLQNGEPSNRFTATKVSLSNYITDVEANKYSRRIGLSPWASDFASLTCAAASMITLVVLLNNYDQTPLEPWTWGITLNGVIAVISFVLKACMSLVLSNSIGQLKWHWSPKKWDLETITIKLNDLQTFDEASRGGIAGIKLMTRIPWAVTRLAGFIVVLTIAFDPILQQLVSYSTIVQKIPSDSVNITRGVTYTMEAPDQRSLQEDRKAGREDQYFANNILGSVILSSYTASLQGIMGLQCPPRSNCSWDRYPTLGLCNQCAQLTDADWETTCGKRPGDCSYNIHGVTQFDIQSTNKDNITTLLFESKEVPSNVSQHWFNIRNPILTFASLKLDSNKAKFHYPPTNTTICTFYPCVRIIASDSVDGQANIGVVGSWRNESTFAATNDMNEIPEDLLDIYMAPSVEDLGIDNENFKDDIYHIPAAVAKLMRSTLRSILLTRLWDTNASTLNYSFSSPGYGNSQLAALVYIYTGSIYPKVFDSVSLAATYYIRSITPPLGQALEAVDVETTVNMQRCDCPIWRSPNFKARSLARHHRETFHFTNSHKAYIHARENAPPHRSTSFGYQESAFAIRIPHVSIDYPRPVMDDPGSLADSPSDATALQPLTPDRVNQQRDSYFSPPRSDHHRDSSIHDKIQQFNNMSKYGPGTAASMTKQLERKTADAALKRAMLGREEAESEMRRFREEARLLRKQIEEGKERERRVGERLETVMENYGRAKETYSHTQALWEKEIRRARKETFKSQSSIVKLQEELKSAKISGRSTEEILEREKEVSQAREQEAFIARYQLVGIQEQLEQALQRIKVIEQERDAFKTLAQNEEVARIAAEGRLPLPQSEEAEDEFASPKKARVSLSTTDILSSAASEAEIEELTRLWQWERQRADRTQEHLEFVEAECRLRTCACAKTVSRRSLTTSARRSRPEPIAIIDPADLAILGKQPGTPVESPCAAEETVIHRPSIQSPVEEVTRATQPENPRQSKGSRRSMVYVPAEGTFRTLSQTELEAMDIVNESPSTGPPSPTDPIPEPRHYARTPSVEPPTFAMMRQERTSLLSLLNAPREDESERPIFNVPTTPGSYPVSEADVEQLEQCEQSEETTATEHIDDREAFRPHTSAACYAVTTTTTTIPLREDENVDPRSYVVSGRRVQGRDRDPSFDVNNPALTPTMTREQALAQIRERRGRARSAAQGAATPRKQMVNGAGERRDVSAPAGRAARGKS
ncbi:hypothetical protein SUNI508_12665 [Seiridium unicorne]|uniref:Uncharacterized protein n=1 Tax=Seiridium unicorne TaxID=138068 RepID=A0ABR2VHR2_9PEZI